MSQECLIVYLLPGLVDRHRVSTVIASRNDECDSWNQQKGDVNVICPAGRASLESGAFLVAGFDFS